MIKVGKVGKRNSEANKLLKEQYLELEIYCCEASLAGCLGQMFMSFHHRHKRHWYLPDSRQSLLSSVNQTILVCQNCHSKLEVDKRLTKEVFTKLRGKEI